MKTEADLNTAILNLLSKINEECPELSPFQEEMPVTIPDENDPLVSIQKLQTYYKSLNTIYNKYKSEHPDPTPTEHPLKPTDENESI